MNDTKNEPEKYITENTEGLITAARDIEKINNQGTETQYVRREKKNVKRNSYTEIRMKKKTRLTKTLGHGYEK